MGRHRCQYPVHHLEVPAHAGLVDPVDRLQCALCGVVFLAYVRHEQGVPEAQLASVLGIRHPRFVVAKQRHVAGGDRARPCPFQNIPEPFSAAQGRRVQAGLV